MKELYEVLKKEIEENRNAPDDEYKSGYINGLYFAIEEVKIRIMQSNGE